MVSSRRSTDKSYFDQNCLSKTLEDDIKPACFGRFSMVPLERPFAELVNHFLSSVLKIRTCTLNCDNNSDTQSYNA